MTFAPPDPKSPLSEQNPLLLGIEQLVELKPRRLTYIALAGLPVTDYRSVMELSGEDACTLTWTSSFVPDAGQEGFAQTLGGLLARGADQIATALCV